MENSISSDLIRGHIDTIILCTLIDKDMFPAEIIKEIEEKSGGDYELNQATLYSSLKRLESIKLVSSYWHDAEIGGRRKFYQITEDGKKAIEKNKNSWQYSSRIIDKLVGNTDEYTLPDDEREERIVQVPVDVTTTNEYKALLDENSKLAKQLEIAKKSATEIKTTQFNYQPTQTYVTEKQEPVQQTQPIRQSQINVDAYMPNRKTALSEVDHRSALNEMIRTSNVVLEKEEKRSNPETDVDSKLSSQDSSSSDKVKITSDFVGQMDFSDLIEKANMDGFKVNVSKQYQASKQKGALYLNKAKFTASLCSYLLFMVELLVVALFLNQFLHFSAWAYVMATFVGALFPASVYMVIKDGINKFVSQKPNIPSEIVSATIVFINLIIIDLAIVVLLGINLSIFSSLFLAVLLPLFVAIDLFLYFVFKYIFVSKNFFAVS